MTCISAKGSNYTEKLALTSSLKGWELGLCLANYTWVHRWSYQGHHCPAEINGFTEGEPKWARWALEQTLILRHKKGRWQKVALDISKEEKKLIKQRGFCFFIGVLGWPQNALKHVAQLAFLIFYQTHLKQASFWGRRSAAGKGFVYTKMIRRQS